jgi:hypothetical protein
MRLSTRLLTGLVLAGWLRLTLDEGEVGDHWTFRTLFAQSTTLAKKVSATSRAHGDLKVTPLKIRPPHRVAHVCESVLSMLLLALENELETGYSWEE